MSIFLKLIKLSLNVNFGISALKYRFTREKRKLWEPVLIGVSALFGIGVFCTLFTLLMSALFQGAKQIGNPEIVLTFAFLAGQLIIFFFGIFYLMSSFYFSKDISILVPLPLKPYQILGSKFIVVMVNEYLTILPILVPALIIYGSGTAQGIGYWIKALLLLLMSPSIPLIIAALFDVLIMRFINLRKSKDLLAIIGGFLGLFFAVGINFFFQSLPKDAGQNYFVNLLASKTTLINSIGHSFPPSAWATFALSEKGFGGFGYLLLFIAVSAGLFLLLLQLGNIVFFKALLAGQEASKKRKKISREKREELLGKTSSATRAIIKREWKLLFRTPIFVMNCLAGMIVGPLFAVIPLISQKSQMSELSRFIFDPALSMVISLGGLGLMIFAAGMNMAASTSVSREGSMFWVSKMIPVPAEIQVKAKVIQSTLLASFGVFATAVVMIFMFHLPVTRMIVILILGILGSVPLTVYSLMIDVLRPKLEWTNPQEAVKSNLNGILGMVVTLLIIGILAVVTVILISAGAYDWIVYTILAATMVILTIPGYLGLMSAARKSYQRIEV